MSKKKVTAPVEEKKRPHILVCTPMYGGQCTGFYTQALLQLAILCKDRGVEMSYCAMFNESLVQRARNGLAHKFMSRDDCTHLMWIDADIWFRPEDILQMIAAEVDVICGIYPKKEINWNSVDKFLKQGVPVDQIRHYTGSFVVNLKDGETDKTVPVNEPFEIWNGGTGFMLVKKDVFLKIKPVVKSYVNDVIDTRNGATPERIYEYFPVFIEPESERLLSEDYAFCKICRENGIQIWAAPWARLGHLGSYLFEGNLIPTA